jgi:hypothetical protein
MTLKRVVWYALAALFLTSVHHAYGAYAYATPWRLHVVPFATIAAIAIGGLAAVLRRRGDDVLGAVAFWSLAAVTLVVPVLLFGAFEGVYNHVVKDVLFAAGSSLETMHRLFPPPTYELPDDLLFEVTGILQVVPAAGAGYYLFVLIRDRLASNRACVGRALPLRKL